MNINLFSSELLQTGHCVLSVRCSSLLTLFSLQALSELSQSKKRLNPYIVRSLTVHVSNYDCCVHVSNYD